MVTELDRLDLKMVIECTRIEEVQFSVLIYMREREKKNREKERDTWASLFLSGILNFS